MSQQFSQQCKLGGYDFLNEVYDREANEIQQFAFAEFDINDATRRIMNRAARAIEGVIGVKPINHTKGVSFVLILQWKNDRGTELDLPSTLQQWANRFREEAFLIYRDAESATIKVRYASPYMAEYSSVEPFGNYNS